eukprot:TRINITY_DN6589_c0_g1_i1.p1 TRINITY_DN6589_c0_g1~~TRINITY_DN6589_c0_g1_i1.p1  ORF type:complete len:446 (-),score=71.38 TRINITY_DN6589_c0_g1_i1:1047-2384(-)
MKSWIFCVDIRCIHFMDKDLYDHYLESIRDSFRRFVDRIMLVSDGCFIDRLTVMFFDDRVMIPFKMNGWDKLYRVIDLIVGSDKGKLEDEVHLGRALSFLCDYVKGEKRKDKGYKALVHVFSSQTLSSVGEDLHKRLEQLQNLGSSIKFLFTKLSHWEFNPFVFLMKDYFCFNLVQIKYHSKYFGQFFQRLLFEVLPKRNVKLILNEQLVLDLESFPSILSLPNLKEVNVCNCHITEVKCKHYCAISNYPQTDMLIKNKLNDYILFDRLVESDKLILNHRCVLIKSSLSQDLIYGYSQHLKGKDEISSARIKELGIYLSKEELCMLLVSPDKQYLKSYYLLIADRAGNCLLSKIACEEQILDTNFVEVCNQDMSAQARLEIEDFFSTENNTAFNPLQYSCGYHHALTKCRKRKKKGKRDAEKPKKSRSMFQKVNLDNLFNISPLN